MDTLDVPVSVPSTTSVVVQGMHMDPDDPKHNDFGEREKGTVLVNHLDPQRDEALGIALSKYNLNYTFDAPDARDFLFGSLLLRDVDPNFLPPSIDLRPKIKAVLDQGSLGSCVANTVAYQLQYTLGTEGIDQSRLFIYYNGRTIAGYPITEDTGLTIRQGFQSVQYHGSCREELCPYIVSQFSMKPSPKAYTVGNMNKGIAYYSISQNLSHLKKCLKDGYLVSFGISLYDSFMSASVARTGIVPEPKSGERRIGGHAMTIVGYDDDKSAFLVLNSWSSTWGDSGYCYVPYKMMMNKSTTGDFWTVRKWSYREPVPEPAPAPAPEPEPQDVPEDVKEDLKEWVPGKFYQISDLVKYNDITYKCTLNHFSISTWIPPNVPALWVRV